MTPEEIKPAECRLCGNRHEEISSSLGLCSECITEREESEHIWREAHRLKRHRFDLMEQPPDEGVACGRCVNACRILEGGRGYCGIRTNVGGEVVLGYEEVPGSAYLDPLPTNCVSEWVCSKGSGDLQRSDHSGRYGTEYNLAVFYGGCTFDCLFCQNWHYREMTSSGSPSITVDSLLEMMSYNTSCICFFGGDPTPFIDHSLEVSRRAREKQELSVCWETNGSMSSVLADKIGKEALESGGCVKIDLKAWDDRLNRALCGSSNRQTIQNIERLSGMAKERPEPPPLMVSTLMVPGYVDEFQVSRIAEFLAELNPSIPYSLLAFHPSYMMNDLPVTSKKQAERCIRAARESGLERIHLGNPWLLR